MSEITRKTQRLLATTGTSVGSASAFRLDDFAGGLVGATATVGSSQNVTFYVSDSLTGTYSQLVDQYGNAVSATLPAGDPTLTFMPLELFAAPWVKMVSSVATACQIIVKS